MMCAILSFAHKVIASCEINGYDRDKSDVDASMIATDDLCKPEVAGSIPVGSIQRQTD